LLLFGGLAALSLPLSVLASPRSATEFAILTREIYPTVTQAMYFGGGSASAPFPFPLGWYWVGVLLSGLLIMAAWYRWRDRRTSRSTPLRGYLATGLVLAAATAALPLLTWGTPIPGASLGLNAWSWLDSLWRLGTFALLAIGVGLAILRGSRGSDPRSRAAAVRPGHAAGGGPAAVAPMSLPPEPGHTCAGPAWPPNDGVDDRGRDQGA
jgi:hypothetical protein